MSEHPEDARGFLSQMAAECLCRRRELEEMGEQLAKRENGKDCGMEESVPDTLHSPAAATPPVLSATLRRADDLLVTAHADAASRAARAAVEMDGALAAMQDDPAHELAAMAELTAVAFEDAMGKVEALLRSADLQHSTAAAATAAAAAPGLLVRAASANGLLGSGSRPRDSAELRRDVAEDVEAARHFGHDAMVRCALAEAMQRKMAPRLEKRGGKAAHSRVLGPATLLLSAVLSGDGEGVRARREAFTAHRERTRELMLR